MIIKNLIRLDFYAMKPLAKIMISFLVVPIILGIITDLGISIMITLTFVVFMLNMIFAIGEKSNFSKLYGILPIKKSMYVLSRYLFSLIIVLLMALISFIIFIFLSLITNGEVNWINGIVYLTVSIVIALFFISIQYPFYFKFDYSKATIMSIIPYILCFAIGSPLLTYLMKNAEFYIQVMKVVNYFHTNVGILVIIGVCVSLFLLGTSYLLSLKVQKKEF